MGIVENAKEITDLVKKVGDIELYRRSVDLQRQATDLVAMNIMLEAESRELKAKLAQKAELKFKQPHYWADGDPIPFCRKCWEKDERQSHLSAPVRWDGGIRRHCSVCGDVVYESPMNWKGLFRGYSGGGPRSLMR